VTLENKKIEEIVEFDIEELVQNSQPEGKTIEYKQALPGRTDSAKKEFLSDVSSFANSAGGNLIYGIKEESGLPIEVCGLSDQNPDAEIQRMESLIRSGIQPRISGVQIRSIPLHQEKFCIIIRIPRSWALPHMVTFKGHDKFYCRNSAGKHPLDVSELRNLFALSDATAQRITHFRRERIGKVIAGECPVLLRDGAKLMIHIIPFGAFDPQVNYDTSLLDNVWSKLPPINAHAFSHRFNFDGLLTYEQADDGSGAFSYTQLFRNGIVEALDAVMIQAGGERKLSIGYEEVVLKFIRHYLNVQQELGVEPPLFVMLSLLKVRGYTIIGPQPSYASRLVHPIDRDDLIVPEIVVETFNSDITLLMRPAFDTVWNAAGHPRSMNYDSEGKWKGS